MGVFGTIAKILVLVIAVLVVLVLLSELGLFDLGRLSGPLPSHGGPNQPKEEKPADSDGDGLTDNEEEALGTNKEVRDTDGDDLSDYDEVRRYHTNPLMKDTDGDTLEDGREISLGANPLNTNTDGDRYDDGIDPSPVVRNYPKIQVENVRDVITPDYVKIGMALISGGASSALFPDLAYLNLDFDLANVGNDYTAWVDGAIDLKVGTETVKTYPFISPRIEPGQRWHYHQELRLGWDDVAKRIWATVKERSLGLDRYLRLEWEGQQYAP